MFANRFKFNTKDTVELIGLVSKEEFATEKFFTSSDLDVSKLRSIQRNIANWEKDGLLLNNKSDPKKKRYYTFLEIFWIYIIIELKQFGFPSKNIKSIKFELYEQYSVGSLLDFLSMQFSRMPQVSEKSKDSENASHEDLMSQLIDDAGFSTLSYVVADCMISKKNMYLAVGVDCASLIVNEESLSDPDSFYIGAFSDTRIIVPLHKILKKILMNEKLNFIAPKLNLLTEQELKIINEIREGQVRSIEVFFKNGKIDRYEKKQLIELDSQARLTELISKAAYQRITIETEDSNIVVVNQVVKEKL